MENAPPRQAASTSGAYCTISDLQHVTEAWPTLPEAVRAGILAMVKAAAAGEDG